MLVLRHSLWILFLLLTACAQSRDMTLHETAAPKVPGVPEEFLLRSPCTPEQILSLDEQREQNPEAAVQAARCYAVPAREGKSSSVRLENAVKGRKLAETAVLHDPKNAAAHYLAAYLAGLEAENDTLRGLSLVPVIERGAMAASRLDPALDHGGPDRMLGELYLRAPDPPVSIGDLDKAILHYQRAVLQDPDFVENRLGLAEAYLENEDREDACDQLQQILTRMPPCSGWERSLKKTTDLMKRLCGMKTHGN
ncbi:MAG: tetratricopeptide repeat protein [Deltaproteobacteria bacterium]|nr:tetratricopeptide repeat protein [Deltaproteobacteria bacterium]